MNGNEISEPLGGGYSIIQPTDGYRFGSDAIALKNFACRYIKTGDKVFDLCSGCGIIGICVAVERGAIVGGAEIDVRLCDMSNRSVAANGLNARFYNVDICDLKTLNGVAGKKCFDAVVCNPPFYKADSRASAIAPAANSELTVTFDNVVDAATALLKSGGGFYTVHTASRLDEILCAVRSRGLTPKELVVNPNGKTFLLRCVAGGRDGMKVTAERF